LRRDFTLRSGQIQGGQFDIGADMAHQRGGGFGQ